MAGPAIDLLWLFRKAPVQTTIAKVLLSRFPNGTARYCLLEDIYGGRDQQPEDAEMCLQTHISKMRRKLEPHGWTIEKSVRHSASYRLVKLED